MGIKAWAKTNDTVWTAPSGAIVTSLVDSDNPLAIRPYTMRFEFSDYSYDPTSESWIDGSFWTQVSSSPNVWDFTYVASVWGTSYVETQPFKGRFVDRGNTVRVLGGNLQGVTGAYMLLAANTALTEVLTFDTSTLQTLEYMFYGCTLLQTIPLLNLASARTVVSMCQGCTALTSIPSIDFSSVLFCSQTFSGCTNLVNVPALDFSSATNFVSLFESCKSLTSAPIMANCGNVTDFTYCFRGCTNLTYVPNIDTTSSTSFRFMFGQCKYLTHAPALNTRHGVDFRNMFDSCENLEEVPLYNTVNADNVNAMFAGCFKVQSGALALYNQMASQLIVPTSHINTFSQCGKDTVSGAAELSQIPTSWGGTMS